MVKLEGIDCVLGIDLKRLKAKLQKNKIMRETTKFLAGESSNLRLKTMLDIRAAQFAENQNCKSIVKVSYTKKGIKFKRLTDQDLDYQKKQIEKFQLKLDYMRAGLQICGHLTKHDYHCKLCENEGREDESLLASKKEVHVCGLRYCSNPECVSQRFKDTLQALQKIKRFDSLRTLHHFVVGFEKVSKEDFENNFNKIKKKHEYVLNAFFKKLRKAGINPQGYRVLDVSKGKQKAEWDQQYYIHYHFITLPFKKQESREIMTKIQAIRSAMLRRQKNKMQFHLQSFGLKEKEALFNYLSLRSNGLYKKFELRYGQYIVYESQPLRESIRQGEFMMLNQLVTDKQYLKYFYGRRHIVAIGDMETLRYGASIADNSVFLTCKYHGKLNIQNLNQVRHQFIIDANPPPDDFELISREERGFKMVNALRIDIIEANLGQIQTKRNKLAALPITPTQQQQRQRLKDQEIIDTNSVTYTKPADLEMPEDVEDYVKTAEFIRRKMASDKQARADAFDAWLKENY